MSLRAQEILELVEQRNAREIAQRRDYYEYLVSRGDRSETLEEHLERYAQVIRTGEAATASEIRSLEDVIGRPLPPELTELYTTIGMLYGHAQCQPEVPSVRSLLQRLGDPSMPRYLKLRSLGLTDMMNAAWSNDRSEFDAETSILSAEELQTLNQAYTCIGWIRSDPGDEGHTYAYFDRDGRFGTIFFHQDEFGEVYEGALVPMMEESPARQTLSEILIDFLRNPCRPLE